MLGLQGGYFGFSIILTAEDSTRGTSISGKNFNWETAGARNGKAVEAKIAPLTSF